MKHLVFFWILGIGPFMLIAQNDPHPKDSISIYEIGLRIHIDYIDDLRSKLDILESPESDILYVKEETYLPKSLPDTIKKYKIILLDEYEIKELAKKSDIEVIAIRPPQISTDHFTLSIIDFYVSYNRKNLNFGNSGGRRLKFVFDCDSNKFILVDP